MVEGKLCLIGITWFLDIAYFEIAPTTTQAVSKSDKDNSVMRNRGKSEVKVEKRLVLQPLTAEELEDTHKNVFDEPPFAAELLAKSIVETLIDRGSERLYETYLRAKVKRWIATTIWT